MAKNGDIYLDSYAGWYSVRQEAYYDESETTVGEDDKAPRAARLAGRVGRGKSYFFRLSAYQDKLLALYETSPISSCRRNAQRGRQLREAA
jgi:methionyl-tRNA synthetase